MVFNHGHAADNVACWSHATAKENNRIAPHNLYSPLEKRSPLSRRVLSPVNRNLRGEPKQEIHVPCTATLSGFDSQREGKENCSLQGQLNLNAAVTPPFLKDNTRGSPFRNVCGSSRSAADSENGAFNLEAAHTPPFLRLIVKSGGPIDDRTITEAEISPSIDASLAELHPELFRAGIFNMSSSHYCPSPTPQSGLDTPICNPTEIWADPSDFWQPVIWASPMYIVDGLEVLDNAAHNTDAVCGPDSESDDYGAVECERYAPMYMPSELIHAEGFAYSETSERCGVQPFWAQPAPAWHTDLPS